VFAGPGAAAGPIARLRLPERISSGTHACWAPL
jgi:carotenoid cleavage dioxygenase-like enzyme